MSIVEYYNALAIRKRVPTKTIPVYNKHMNRVLLKRLICNILNDIDRIKNINSVKEKILTGITFEGNMFTNGIWNYAIIEDTNTVSVKLNAEAFSEQFGEASTVTLGHEYMPYERLIDTEGNEYITSSYAYMFSELPNEVTSLTIDNWTNCNVTNMGYMFCLRSGLTTLELGNNFNTSSVSDMSRMFYMCLGLTTLTLGNNFNTSSVSDMGSMFYGCSKLTTLELGNNFNTSSVSDMSYMFHGCSSLISLTLGNTFNTSNVTNMTSMFNNCSSLISLTLGNNFNSSGVTNMTSMFNKCSNLTTLKLYESAESIIIQLPTSDNWIVTDSNSENIGTINITRGISAIWNPSKPNPWTDVPWTLWRTLS